MINENLKTLPDYLDEITESDLNRDESLESELENAIAQKMPGYKIYAWDADQYGSVEFAESYTDLISRHIRDEVIEDIQQGTWISEDNCNVLIVIAMKTK